MKYGKGRHRQAKEARIAELRQRPASEWGDHAPNRERLFELDASLVGHLVYPGDPRLQQGPAGLEPCVPGLPAGDRVLRDRGRRALACLIFATRSFLPVAVRSGGHCTTGYSVNSGFVIDTSGLNSVTVDVDTMTAVVGAGTDFKKLNNVLDAYGVHVPGGECDDVCVAGFMQGGGYGYTSRMYGMNLDSVLAMTVMLFDSRIITASPTVNWDLFWAMRGGTGGNFGVLIDITYRVHNLSQVWAWALEWPIAMAPQVMVALQAGYMKTGDSRLGYTGNIGYNPSNKQILLIEGMFTGSPNDGRTLLQPLQQLGGTYLVDETGSYAAMDLWLEDHPYPIPNVPDVGTKEIKQAGYIDRKLTLAEWTSVISYYQNGGNGPPKTYNTAIFEPYGGAINNVPVDATAFIHRNCDLNFFVDAFWVDDADEAAAVAWLDGYMNVMAPLTNGHCYQNYPRRDLPDYQWMYWGQALPSLLDVRAKYDPNHFFQFPQCVQSLSSPAPQGADTPLIAPRPAPAEIVYPTPH